MKALSPAHVATALVLSLASSVVTAKGMTTTTTTARPSSSVTTTATGTTTAGTTSGGTAATETAATGTTFSATPALNNSTARLQSAPADTSGTSSTANAADSSTSVTTTTPPLSTDTGGTPSQATFGRDTSFGNDSGNAALGTSPGQTSSGTQAGNSGIGIPAGSDTLQNSGTATTGTPAVTTLGGAGALGRNAVIVPGTGMAGSVAVNVNPSATTAPIVTRTPTPVFDEAARRGMAQVQREARSGHVFGQAPRTDNDRTDQMPDDPIIRY